MTKPPEHSPEELRRIRENLERDRERTLNQILEIDTKLQAFVSTLPSEQKRAAEERKALKIQRRQLERELGSDEGRIKNVDAQIRAAQKREERRDRELDTEDRVQSRTKIRERDRERDR